jgi:hypothetical protein
MAKIIFEYEVICVRCGCELDIEIGGSTPSIQLAVKSCPVCDKIKKVEIKETLLKEIDKRLKKWEDESKNELELIKKTF